mmetsp:Transcript_25487/g.40551  ORF Transcript_25487/g.40551 Transcript_25487/m.40551 type:complete len:211 (-) Transcript_25487:508-1140(-)
MANASRDGAQLQLCGGHHLCEQDHFQRVRLPVRHLSDGVSFCDDLLWLSYLIAKTHLVFHSARSQHPGSDSNLSGLLRLRHLQQPLTADQLCRLLPANEGDDDSRGRNHTVRILRSEHVAQRDAVVADRGDRRGHRDVQRGGAPVLGLYLRGLRHPLHLVLPSVGQIASARSGSVAAAVALLSSAHLCHSRVYRHSAVRSHLHSNRWRTL